MEADASICFSQTAVPWPVQATSSELRINRNPDSWREQAPGCLEPEIRLSLPMFRAVQGEPFLGSTWGHCLPSGSMPSDSTGHLISGLLCFLCCSPQVTLDKQLSEHESGLAHLKNGILNRRFTAGLPGQGTLE